MFRGKAKPDPESGRLGFLLLITVLLIGYYFAILTAGYFISSFVFLALMMHVLAFKNRWIIFGVSAGWVLFSCIFTGISVQLSLCWCLLLSGYVENIFSGKHK